MALASGQKIGSCEIVAPLGADDLKNELKVIVNWPAMVATSK